MIYSGVFGGRSRRGGGLRLPLLRSVCGGERGVDEVGLPVAHPPAGDAVVRPALPSGPLHGPLQTAQLARLQERAQLGQRRSRQEPLPLRQLDAVDVLGVGLVVARRLPGSLLHRPRRQEEELHIS